MTKKEIFPGVFLIDNKLATRATFKGARFFDEKVENGFRPWDPNRSKAGAAIVRGIGQFPIKEGSKVLYLGAAHGYTPSHLADITGKEGIIYAVEFSDRCFNDLLPITEKYTMIVPILADARFPEKYSWIEKVDVVYCDIADPQMTEIAVRNCRAFLKPKGFLMLAIKSRSIDVVASPSHVVKSEIEKLKKDFRIMDWKMLDPFEKDHGFVVARSIK